MNAPPHQDKLVNANQTCAYDAVGFIEDESIAVDDRSPCTATLVAPNVVLTAAHCWQNTSNKPAPGTSKAIGTIAFSTIDCSGKVQKIYSQQVLQPSCSSNADIMLIALVSNASNAISIPVIEYDDVVAPENRVTLVGFGANSPTGIPVPMGPDPTPTYKWVGTNFVSAVTNGNIIFNADPGSGGDGETGYATACFGDSGGPAFLDNNQGKLGGVITQGNCQYSSIVYDLHYCATPLAAGIIQDSPGPTSVGFGSPYTPPPPNSTSPLQTFTVVQGITL